ncbi:polymer-forming cytoskeletal protein [Halomontanus rarus]|uniref:DUF7289 family protein n=1 Tax=Halomontanus rarus TaxID=3034020 RepID=UPI001A98A782
MEAKRRVRTIGPIQYHRGQMAVLGLVLLIGVVVIASIGILLVAGQSTDDVEQQAETDRVEQSFVQMSKELETASSSHDVSRGTDFSLDGQNVRVDPSAGNMTVEITGDSSCMIVDDQQLGSVQYTQNGNEIALQGGGVWRHDGSTSTMVSSPSIHYRPGIDEREPTLTLPIVTITGDERITDRANINHLGTTKKYPSSSACGDLGQDELLTNSDVVITIQSKYSEAWGQFFEDSSSSNVKYPSDGTVQITLSGPIESGEIEGPIVSDAPTLALSNNGKIDSYDSTDGPYTSGGENAPVIVEGDFKPSNSVEIGGDVRAGGDADISNNILVSGKTIVAGESDISNNPEFGGLYSSGGDLSAFGGTFRGDLIVDGDLTQIQGATVEGTVHVNGDATVGKNTEIQGDLIVDGNVSLAKKATVDGEIHASGDVTLNHQAEHRNDIYAGGSVALESSGSTLVGTVRSNEAVELFYNAKVTDDVYARDDVSIDSSADVDGDVIAGGSVDPGRVNEDSISENVSPKPQTTYRSPSSSVDPGINYPDPVTDEIIDTKSRLADSNDNDETLTVVNDELVGCELTCTLESGSYYLDHVTFDSDDTLVFDTSDGPIDLYVDEDIALTNKAEIEIQGDNGVEVFLNGDLDMSKQAAITEAGDRSPLFWLNMNPDSSAKFSNRASFVGIVYGPGSETRDGVDVHISNQVEIFGAIVGNVGGTSNKNSIHFDEALIDSEQFGSGNETGRLSYLNIAHHEVDVGTN